MEMVTWCSNLRVWNLQSCILPSVCILSWAFWSTQSMVFTLHWLRWKCKSARTSLNSVLFESTMHTAYSNISHFSVCAVKVITELTFLTSQKRNFHNILKQQSSTTKLTMAPKWCVYLLEEFLCSLKKNWQTINAVVYDPWSTNW